MKGLVIGVWSLGLLFAVACLATESATAGDCFRQPVVVQQFVAHPVRQQVVVAPVRQQVVRQQIVQPAAVPSVSVVRRGIFGNPRTQIRIGN